MQSQQLNVDGSFAAHSQFKRDALGQLQQQIASNGAIARFAFEPVGRLTQANNPHHELYWGYSPAGQLTVTPDDVTPDRHSNSPT